MNWPSKSTETYWGYRPRFYTVPLGTYEDPNLLTGDQLEDIAEIYGSEYAIAIKKAEEVLYEGYYKNTDDIMDNVVLFMKQDKNINLEKGKLIEIFVDYLE